MGQQGIVKSNKQKDMYPMEQEFISHQMKQEWRVHKQPRVGEACGKLQRA